MGNKMHDAGDGGAYLFWCPGCQEYHQIPVPRWQFNGDMQRPTFTPSLLHPEASYPGRQCHLFITDGSIQYLSDCWHGLRGQTVPMEKSSIDPPGAE